jgi:glycerophosphoryl diester phosphodiesterase
MANKLFPNIIAHRGESGKAPENTLNAIQRAVQLHVDWVEVDVHLSKEGIPVILHDDSLERITKGCSAELVHHLTLDEIKSYEVGSWFNPAFFGEQIPTLDEVLNIPFGETGLMIEIKSSPWSPSVVVEAVLNVVKMNQWDTCKLMIGSFALSIIQELQRSFPPLQIIGIAETDEEIDLLVQCGVKWIALWVKLVTPYLITALHEKGIKVWCFTVDDLVTAKFLSSLRIDGLITNFPNGVLQEV